MNNIHQKGVYFKNPPSQLAAIVSVFEYLPGLAVDRLILLGTPVINRVCLSRAPTGVMSKQVERAGWS
jgi:hypothetical protein